MKNLEKRNRINFGLGTIGRDMFYAFESNALLYFLTHILSLPEWVFGAAVLVLTVMRVFDAFNDPITGLLIDNIRSPWGKFKPAILVGGTSASASTTSATGPCCPFCLPISGSVKKPVPLPGFAPALVLMR